MPISMRRLATADAVTPYNPKPASSSASAPKNAESMATSRSWTSDSSTTIDSGRNVIVSSRLTPVGAAATLLVSRAGEPLAERNAMKK
jgi:hypothetical protein